MLSQTSVKYNPVIATTLPSRRYTSHDIVARFQVALPLPKPASEFEIVRNSDESQVSYGNVPTVRNAKTGAISPRVFSKIVLFADNIDSVEIKVRNENFGAAFDYIMGQKLINELDFELGPVLKNEKGRSMTHLTAYKDLTGHEALKLKILARNIEQTYA